MTDSFEVLDALLAPPSNSELNELLAAKKAKLQHIEGYVALAVSGTVTIAGLKVPYHLVPPSGIVAKKGKWGKANAGLRQKLVQDTLAKQLSEECEELLVKELTPFVETLTAHGLELEPRILRALDAPAFKATERIASFRNRVNAAVAQQAADGLAEMTRSAINLADYPASFALAQSMQRKFIALLGEPNSGKTHEAMEHLARAKSGVYLAPLRLLALENYERLQQAGVCVSMVTGEECRLQEGATHVASTIEMLNYQRPVEVAVVDEIQMLGEPGRGASWTTAVCGAPAETVYLVGSLASRSAIEALAERLGCELEIKELYRKSPLTVEEGPVKALKNLRKGDAVIAFSRRDVLLWRDNLTAAGFSVATIYGNLSPEVRRAQAALFREGKVDILVGTDALGMGLNLPISRVVFTTAVKFDGIEEAELPAWLTQQIGGRAGRFGIKDQGLVAGFDGTTHRQIKRLMAEPLTLTPAHGFYVAPTMEHLKRIQEITTESRLATLLERFVSDVDTYDGFFIPANMAEPLERAQWLDNLSLSLEDRFLLSLVPISSKVDWLQAELETWALNWSNARVSHAPAIQTLELGADLQRAEDACKLYSAYAWLGYRRPKFFPDAEQAVSNVRTISAKIDALLQKQNSQRKNSKVDSRKSARKYERPQSVVVHKSTVGPSHAAALTQSPLSRPGRRRRDI